MGVYESVTRTLYCDGCDYFEESYDGDSAPRGGITWDIARSLDGVYFESKNRYFCNDCLGIAALCCHASKEQIEDKDINMDVYKKAIDSAVKSRWGYIGGHIRITEETVVYLLQQFGSVQEWRDAEPYLELDISLLSTEIIDELIKNFAPNINFSISICALSNEKLSFLSEIVSEVDNGLVIIEQGDLGKLTLSNLENLDPVPLSIEYSKSIELSELDAEKLGRLQGEGLWLDLTELSDAAAANLSEYQGDCLSLQGLTELSDAAAESLSKYQGTYLIFNGLTKLSDAAAESLSKFKGVLDLQGLTELSDAAAESLSKYEGDLNFYHLTELSDAAAESLSKFKGVLGLDGLTKLSDAAAESLSKYEGDEQGLSLYGLTELSDPAAESLSKCKVFLCLNRLTELSDAAAESLSKHRSKLRLQRLTELSDAAAESLSKHSNLEISIDNLPASAAQILRDAGHG